jgi:DNA-binding response OmpR family regulator
VKILLVEDDPAIAAVLSEVLTAHCYTVDLATDGQMGLECATSWDYELILLDLLIPKLDGIHLCRQLRTQGYRKPILLLTAKDSSTDIVQGLDAGADDYVTKPYDLSELLARIRALLRRREKLAPSVLVWGELCVNSLSAEVTYAGQKLSLTPKEYSLLGLFLRNPQRVFSRSDIIDQLWSIDASPSEGAVTNLIKDLRQKLKTAGMSTDLLETVYGLGYRLRTAPDMKEQGSKAKLEGNQERLEKGMASVHRVLKRYQHTFAVRVEKLAQVGQALHAGTLSADGRDGASQEAHKLAGVLGSFGYEAGSRIAQSIEHLLITHQTIGKTEATQFSSLIIALQQEIAKPPKPLTIEPVETAHLIEMIVIDDQISFANQLKENAAVWGFQVEIATNLTIAQQQISQCLPSAILLSLDLQNAETDGLTQLRQLREQYPTLPILAITEQDNFIDRVTVSRLGVQRFLHQPIEIAQVFAAIGQVLPKRRSSKARVIIVDDDPIALSALGNLLRPWGLDVISLQDPVQFWQVLTTAKPDLIVMDLEMPEFSGIDLCRVVRQDPQWGDLPVLVVTAHTDIESIQQVFAAGADDFIGKPVVGPELVTRVISRIDRSRLQQELETMKRRIGT